MAIDTSLLTDYTGAQLKLAAKHAMMTAAVGGGELIINGRTIGRITIDAAKKLYEFAEQLSADEATDSGGGLALVQYGERV